jgi:glycosyltransferase involved in cell wall biosynthesis
MDRYECIGKIKEVTEIVRGQHPASTLPNVYLLHGELTDMEMNALYNHEKVKVHVSFTHGEGYGHPLLLSTLSGKPLLAPRWSGHLDFLNPSFTKFFEGKLVPIPGEAVNDWFVKDAQWYEVDYEAAGRKMKDYFNNYTDKMEDAEKLRAENEKKFSLEAMDKEFHSILDRCVPKFSTEQIINLPKLKKLNLPKLNKGPVVMPAGGCAPQDDKSTPPATAPTTITQTTPST